MSPESVDAAPEADSAAVMIPVTGSSAPAALRLLPNATSLPEENFIRALPSRGIGGRMSLEGALRSAAPLPHPFEYAIASDFTAASVGAGNIRYLARSLEEGVTCVLAVGSGDTALPGSATVIMRNCVNGDLSSALAPIAASGGF